MEVLAIIAVIWIFFTLAAGALGQAPRPPLRKPQLRKGK